MKKDWTNNLVFKMNFTISDKTNVTKFMVDHKMFPGNICKCSLTMRPCHQHYNGGRSLVINVAVIERMTGKLLDKFEMKQGSFTKLMENIHAPEISTWLN